MVRAARGYGGLSSEQEAVLIAMMSGKSQKEAAEESGVAPETVSRWLAEPMGAFREELQERRRAVTEFHIGRLRSLVSDACDVLAELLESKSEGIRLRAALAVLKAAGLGD